MKIGTHNGAFHADDVLAVAMLRHLHPADVVRTRDPKILATCDVVVDVGGEYDPTTRRYDHHQKGRAGARPSGILYSAAGLVGLHELRPVLGDAVYAELDRQLIAAVCATDNGQALHAGGPAFDGVSGYSLSAALSAFNPAWHETPDFDGAFERAVAFAGAVLEREISSATGAAEAERLTREALAAAGPGAKVIVLDRFHPWTEVIVTEAPDALFVAYPSETGDWRLQAVPPEVGSFAQRKALPAAWAAQSAADLARLTGRDDAVFCHPGRFICGARSRESVLALAALAIDA